MMNHERAKTLIEAYGGNTDCWPEQERQQALALVAGSHELQDCYAQAQQLDAALTAAEQEQRVDEALLGKLVENLPEQGRVNHRGWLQRWPVSIAAGFAIVAITFSVMQQSPVQTQPEQFALQDIDYWLWQDVTDQVSFETNEEPVTDFMSIL